MKNVVIDLPQVKDLKVDTSDLSLYNYNFDDFSLVPIREIASKNVYRSIYKSFKENSISSKLINETINGDEVEYVAKLTDSVKEKIANGKFSFVIEKITGETKASLRDNETGQIASSINLEEKVISNLGNLSELAAMQSKLNEISNQIEVLNYNIQRVEQGQYNDRYAGFFSTRQLLIESIGINNLGFKRQLLSSAIQVSNETIAKLMLAIRHDANQFLDFKIKKSHADTLEGKINESLSYLNSVVQLTYIAYTILEEPKALLASMSNYKSFLDQTLLTPLGESTRSVAWKIDNARVDDSNSFFDLTNRISNSIDGLITDNLWISMEDMKHEEI